MRLILDIANQQDTRLKRKLTTITDAVSNALGDPAISLICVEQSNHAQFHDDPMKNKLTAKQIQRQTTNQY